MTRETKVGLVVASSFVCLVGVVVASRWGLQFGTSPPRRPKTSRRKIPNQKSQRTRNRKKCLTAKRKRRVASLWPRAMKIRSINRPPSSLPTPRLPIRCRYGDAYRF